MLDQWFEQDVRPRMRQSRPVQKSKLQPNSYVKRGSDDSLLLEMLRVHAILDCRMDS